jgi:hypothetical protein
LSENDGISDTLKYIRAVIPQLPGAGTIAIFIEEIPLSPGPDYSRFLEMIFHIALDMETFESSFRIIWLFSSIDDPKSHIHSNRPKFLEKFQFIDLNLWSFEESKLLLDLILANTPLSLTESEKKQLILCAAGSPRYIKVALRRRRTEIGLNMPILELLHSVSVDLNPNE